MFSALLAVFERLTFVKEPTEVRRRNSAGLSILAREVLLRSTVAVPFVLFQALSARLERHVASRVDHIEKAFGVSD